VVFVSSNILNKKFDYLKIKSGSFSSGTVRPPELPYKLSLQTHTFKPWGSKIFCYRWHFVGKINYVWGENDVCL